LRRGTSDGALSYRVVPRTTGWHWEIVLDQSILMEGDELTSAAARAQACRALIELEDMIRPAKPS
jgi:hypothetical protein